MNAGKKAYKNMQRSKIWQWLPIKFLGIGLAVLFLLGACTNTPATLSDINPTETLAPTEEIDSGNVQAAPEESGISDQCQAYAAAVNQKMSDAAGWVHGVKDRAHFNNTSGEYDPSVTEEFWYRFDFEGLILEGYNWTETQEGEIQQEGVWLNGWYDGEYINGAYNLDVDFGPDGDIQGPHSVVDAPMDFSAGFCSNLEHEESAIMDEVDFHGQSAWKFFYESVAPGGILIKAIYFGQDGGALLGFDSMLVQADGSEKLISEVVYRIFELNAVPPQERFAELSARIPHRDEFVPFEEGTFEIDEAFFYPPIVVVTISRSSSIEIQSTVLNQDLTYSAIPIDENTVLRGQPAIDSDNYLYIPYGSQKNYLAKLGPDGSVTTIEINTDWHYDSQWVGDKFLIVPFSSSEMVLIGPDLTIETIPNSLAYLDGKHKFGYLGLSNASPREAIWSFSTPLRSEGGDFALYRTFNIDTGEMSEFQMEVPSTAKENLPNPENEDEKMGLIVYGIDNANQNALICYAMFPNGAFQTTLELYDGDSGTTITKEVRCCLNNKFNLEGEAIIEDTAFESCCNPAVRNWIDYEPTFSYASLLRSDDGSKISFIPFSDAWLIATETRVIVVDTQNHAYPAYDLPDDIKYQFYQTARPISD